MQWPSGHCGKLTHHDLADVSRAVAGQLDEDDCNTYILEFAGNDTVQALVVHNIHIRRAFPPISICNPISTSAVRMKYN